MSAKDRLAVAEKALADLERPKQTVEHAHAAHVRAQQDGDPANIAAAKARHAAAMKAHLESGVTDRQVAVAAQAVLDAREEAEKESPKK